MTNTQALTGAIKTEVTRLGGRVFRNQVGKYQTADGRWISTGLAVGSSDLIGWTRNGKFLAIEIKAGKDRLSTDQWNFLQTVRNASGIGIAARSLEDVMLGLSDP